MLQEVVMEGGTRGTWMLVVTETEYTAPLLTVLLKTWSLSGLETEIVSLARRDSTDLVLLLMAGSQDNWKEGRGKTFSTSQLSCRRSPVTE